MKEQSSKEREQLQSQIKELTTQTYDQQDEIKELKQHIESLKNNHLIELERLAEKKDFEKDKAVLEAERNYQAKLLEANNEYNEKIRELYNEISNVRKEYENKTKDLELEFKISRDEQNQIKEKLE